MDCIKYKHIFTYVKYPGLNVFTRNCTFSLRYSLYEFFFNAVDFTLFYAIKNWGQKFNDFILVYLKN